MRNFSLIEGTQVKRVVDPGEDVSAYIKKNYAGTEFSSDLKDIVSDPEIEAVVVATPAQTHYEITRELLGADKHCFVEKPLSATFREAEELVELAESQKRVLMVGHIFEYNPAVKLLKKYITEGLIGDIYYIYSQRLNLGKIRDDVNALWNLAPHDVSIILYLIGEMPVSVSAQGMSYIQKGIEDVVFLNLKFAGGICGHIHVSWLDPNKVRRLTLVGSKKMVVYDDVADNKIQIFDKGVDSFESREASLGKYEDFGEFQLRLRAGDILIPKVEFDEPLKTETAHFIECIREGKNPISDGRDGLRVTKILEAAMESVRQSSKEVAVK